MNRTLLMIGCLTSGLAWASDFKAAWVDMQRAISECDEGRVAKRKLQQLSGDKQKDIDAERDALKVENERVLQLPAGPDRKKAEDDLRRRLNALSERAERTRVELAELERKELANVVPKLEAILSQISRREGFTMVFDRASNALAFAQPSLDLTNELIRAYNAQYPLKAPLK